MLLPWTSNPPPCSCWNACRWLWSTAKPREQAKDLHVCHHTAKNPPPCSVEQQNPSKLADRQRLPLTSHHRTTLTARPECTMTFIYDDDDDAASYSKAIIMKHFFFKKRKKIPKHTTSTTVYYHEALISTVVEVFSMFVTTKITCYVRCV